MTSTLLATALPRTTLVRVSAVVLGSLLLAASAKVQVPFWPVPMTMQTTVVLVIGMAYGWRLGAATVALYLAQGLMGLPVFAGPTAGPAYMMGPTAGYLVGFLAAGGLIGWLADKGWDRSMGLTLLAMAGGHAVIFLFGVLWLSHLVGMEKAIAVGLTPFIAASILKTVLGLAIVRAGWAMTRRA